MVETKRKEELSISYLNTLCAYVGVSMEKLHHDDDSIDVIVKKSMKRTDGCRYDAQLAIQLKSTSQILKEDEHYINYPLKIKNYNDLRAKSTMPKILALLVLPSDEANWITHSVNELIIRKCMYWESLLKYPQCDNDTNKTIKLKKSEYVTSEKLIELLQRIAEEEEL